MIRLIWTLSAHTRYYLRRYMPTNRLLDAIRRRPNLRWGIPAMLLAVPYFLIAITLANHIQSGGPGWLNLIVLLTIWNGIKMLWLGPISLILLARVRIHEHGQRREDHEAETALVRG